MPLLTLHSCELEEEAAFCKVMQGVVQGCKHAGVLKSCSNWRSSTRKNDRAAGTSADGTCTKTKQAGDHRRGTAGRTATHQRNPPGTPSETDFSRYLLPYCPGTLFQPTEVMWMLYCYENSQHAIGWQIHSSLVDHMVENKLVSVTRTVI